MYSSAWKYRNSAPSTTVAPSQHQQRLAARRRLQRVVGHGDGHARGQQDQGVEQRQAPGRDGLEVRRRSSAGPLVGQPAVKPLPQELVGQRAVAFAAEPRQRELARVEQRAEERGEEHHLREDEPHHAHAERGVDLRVVAALQRLARSRRRTTPNSTPASSPGRRRTRSRPRRVPFNQLATPIISGEQGDRAEERPAAVVRDEVDVRRRAWVRVPWGFPGFLKVWSVAPLRSRQAGRCRPGAFNCAVAVSLMIESIRQGDRRHVARQRRVDDEAHRHQPRSRRPAASAR